MGKVSYKKLLFIPEAKSFTELGINTPTEEEEVVVDIGDNGIQSERMYSDMQADFLLLDVLFGFNDRQKVVLLYQILRESGFNLNHSDCAQTLSMTREHYMVVLKGVKKKARKILQDIEE